MQSNPARIPSRFIVINIALVLAWVPVLLMARHLVDGVIAGSPSDQLLTAAHLAVIGTLVIITSAYLFGIVLINKFATQNTDGVQRRIIRPTLLAAAVLYVVVGVYLFI